MVIYICALYTYVPILTFITIWNSIANENLFLSVTYFISTIVLLISCDHFSDQQPSITSDFELGVSFCG